MTDRVYEELLHRADVLLTSGESVILDASWSAADHRRLAGRLADRHGAELIQVECRLDVEETRRRIRQRTSEGTDPSDVTVATAEEIATRRDPWPEARTVSTHGSIDEACARVRTLLDDHAAHRRGT